MQINDNNAEMLENLISIHTRMRDLKIFQLCKVLNQNEFFVLGKLFMSEKIGDSTAEAPLSMSALSKRMRCSPAMATKMINALESKGCVARKLCDSDRRGVNVYITEKGRELWLEEYEFKVQLIRKIFSRFGDEKCETLFKLSDELLTLFETETEKYIQENQQNKYNKDSKDKT